MVTKTAFKLSKGFKPDQTEKAVDLFWQAFKGKLSPVMGPEDKALKFLSSVINPDFAISASDHHGKLLGIAGFKTSKGGFTDGTLKDIANVYGWIGGIWRGTILSLLERPLQPNTLLMDGIFVSKDARGKGIGSALLSAIKDKAKTLNYHQVRLDVINTNPRARDLYERKGFVPLSTTHIGPLKYIFGFKEVTTMICKVI